MRKSTDLARISIDLTDRLTKFACDLMDIHSRLSVLTEQESHRVFLVGASFFIGNIAAGVRNVDPETWIREFQKELDSPQVKAHIKVKREEFMTALRKHIIKGAKTE